MNMNKLVAITVVVGTTVATLQSYADTNITEHVMLTEDADWTSLGTVNIAADAGIHLNGHNLTVSGFAGEGSIYSSALPPGYAVLEYVETDSGQYIDTGVAPSSSASSVKVDADVAYMGSNVTSAYVPLVASANNDNRTNVGLWLSPVSSTLKWSVCNPDNWFKSGSVIGQGQRSHVIATWEKDYESLAIDGGTAVRNNSKKSQSVSNTMYLPAKNKGGIAGEKGHFKIYSLKLYRPQTTLVRDYVPMKRLSDEKAGLYDRVSGTFFPSVTDTPFSEGPEVGRSGGELRINVASGTFQNSTVAISNSVKVVKLGTGTYRSSKTQSYIGGTAVNGGHVDSTVSHGFGAAGTAFCISNARVDIRGQSDTLKDYDVTIEDVGTAEVIQGAAKITGGSGYEKSFLKSLTLSGDASIGVWQEDAFGLTHNTGSIQPFTLTLNGHTLTIQGNSRLCANRVTVSDGGTINVRRSAGTSNTQFYPRGVLNAPLVTLDIGANATMKGDSGFVVSNLVFSGTGGSQSTTVLGCYSPKVNSSLPTVVLGDATHHAPKLDLGGVSAAIGGVSFAEGSTVAVDVGSRTVNVGDRLVSWSAGAGPDSTVSFRLLANGVAPENLALVVRENDEYHGLYVKSTLIPAYAEWDVENNGWKFFMADGSLYPDEWTGGVTSDMQVRFHTYAQYLASIAAGVNPAEYMMTGLVLDENMGTVDITTLPFVLSPAGIAAIDLKGNTLLMPTVLADASVSVPVTDTVGGGKIVFDVASGTVVNSAVRISGLAKLVKRGAGTFVSALAQTYTGGTDVLAGRVQPPDSPADSNYTYSGDNFTAFGTGMVNVLPGAVCDVRGNYAYTNVVLKGGAIANTLRTMSQTAKPGVFVASLADADVSQFNMYLSGSGQCNTSYGKAGLATDLGGKTLEIVEWGSLSLRSALTNGTVRVVESNGWFRFEAALDMRTATFDNLCAIQVNNNVDLGTYIQRKDTKFILGSGKMTIHERFVPVSGTYFYGCTMLDGSTLDLSQRDTLFTSSCTNHENKVYSVAFPASGTLNVEIGERRVKRGDQLVAWTAKPAGTAKFKLTRNGVPATGRRLAVMDDGLYVGNSGFILIVK